jgi:hypothetical protein
MPSIDSLYKGDIWERKRQFLSPYKFTIAFENYVYPGYQTEKLYDAMRCNTLPIYCGDPNIGDIFNTKSFVNAGDFINLNKNSIINILEDFSQQNFNEYRPKFYNHPYYQISRKIKSAGRKLKMSVQFNKLDFSPLIDRIIEIDENEDLYIKYLREPWFNENSIPISAFLKDQWIEIFNTKK